MDANKSHITQISRSDLAELAAMSRLTVGDGLRLVKSGSGWRLEIDEIVIMELLSRAGVVIFQ